MLLHHVLSLVCSFLSDQCFCKRCFIECTFDMLKQQPEVISGLRSCGGRRGQWSFSFCHSVSADTPPPPHGLTYTFSISFLHCFPPFLICLNLSMERPPPPLTTSLSHYSTSLSLPCPLHYTPPTTSTTTMLFQCCCLSLSNNCTPDRAQWVLLQTHPGRHTSIHAHGQAHTHAHTNASTLLHAQGLVPHRGLLLAALWEMNGERTDIVCSYQNNCSSQIMHICPN